MIKNNNNNNSKILGLLLIVFGATLLVVSVGKYIIEALLAIIAIVSINFGLKKLGQPSLQKLILSWINSLDFN